MDFSLWLFPLMFFVSIAVAFAIRRPGLDCKPLLEPVLAEKNLTIVTCDFPGLFRLGPFPKVEMYIQPVRTRVMNIRGEYTRLRKLRVRDTEGKEHELWVRLEYQAFRLGGFRFSDNPWGLNTDSIYLKVL